MIRGLTATPLVQARDIWVAERPDPTGHEQRGLHPVLVIAVSNQAEVCTVVPLTSTTDMLRFPYTCQIECSKYNGLMGDSVALVFQITCYDFTRFLKKDAHKIGKLEQNHFDRVCVLLKKYLQL